MPDPGDRAIYDEDEAAPSRRSRLGGIVAVLAMLGFGAGLWYVYDRSVRRGDLSPPPVVTADPAPVKSAPADPGGMVVPNQQTRILNQGGKQPEPKVESLLPPQELPKPEPPPAPATTVPAPPPVQAAVPQPAPLPAPVPNMPSAPVGAVDVARVPAAEPPKAPVPAPATPAAEPPADVTAVTPKTPPQPVAAPAQPAAAAPVAPAPAPAAAGGGGVRIQLASLPDAATADREWKRLQRTHADLLGKVSSRVVPVQLEGKGTWYRLQAGPFVDKSAAQQTCDALKQRKLGCFLAP